MRAGPEARGGRDVRPGRLDEEGRRRHREAPRLGGGRSAGGLRRPRPPGGRASAGVGGGEVPHDGPEGGRLAGGERGGWAGGVRPAPVAPAAAEDFESCWSGSTRSCSG